MVLVFAESDDKGFKKSSFEAITYGRDLADKTGTKCIALAIGNASGADALANYGAQEVIVHNGNGTESFDPDVYTAALGEAVDASSAQTVIFGATYTGKALAPKIAARKGASLVCGVVDMVNTESSWTVRKSCFSNKAFTDIELKNDFKVISLIPNSYTVKSFDGSAAVSELNTDLTANAKSRSVEVKKAAGKIPLTEADVVVSAGRGLKGPENWGMIEELADLLGAATACSKPVSDMEWRPHSEHVGQTGITIKPNLYIAIGISGAIQHLAGVGSSKVICVINTDPEAPFFKAADYGIVGDAFEVVPKLIERARELKA